MQLVIGSAAHLLSLVDAPSSHEAKSNKTKALELEKKRLAEARAYYREAATGQAQVDYFLGMMVSVVVLVVAAIVAGTQVELAGVNSREFFGCLMAGAIGAVVSVLSRIGSGHFGISFEVGRQYPFFLGGLRPVVGAVFGVGLYFAVISDALGIFKIPKDVDNRFYFLLVIAFAAGFSERWARDTLLNVGGAAKATTRRVVAKGGKKEEVRAEIETS
jgi:hypothetical protein